MGLGFTEFFFPLFTLLLGMGGLTQRPASNRHEWPKAALRTGGRRRRARNRG
jgi:hypothetical protein